MNKLKERLFGLIVVIALGVIFVPMLLENTQSPKSSVMQDVPAVPVAKNELDNGAKPELLATLKESPKEEQVTHDENQPIADRPDQGVKPGPKEDLKIKEKLAMAEVKAEQERLAAQEEKRAAALAEKQDKEKLTQAKLDEHKRHQAEMAAQKLAVQKLSAEKLAAEKRLQAEIAQAKLEQARLEQEKLAQHKQQEELLQAKLAEEKAEEKAEEDKQAEIIKKPTKPVKMPLQRGWVVQLGSFAEHQNASALLKKLRVAGYPAFTRNVNRNGLHLTVVMVGPHARREDADRLISTLAMKFQIDGIVVRYEPR